MRSSEDSRAHLEPSVRDTELDLKSMVERMVLDDSDRPRGGRDGAGNNLSGSLVGGGRCRHVDCWDGLQVGRIEEAASRKVKHREE